MNTKEALKKLAKQTRKAAASEAYATALKLPIRRGTVLYESFSGNGMLCNPEALFHELNTRPDTKHLRHIWVLASFEDYAETIKRYRGDRGVRFVKYRSPAYFSALARSEYLVNNATFPWEFMKRPGQTYVNAWHGTPLKKMGYDVEGGAADTRNIVRNFVQADYLVAGNERMRDMYMRAYRMTNIFEGAVLQCGYPRIDRQLVTDTDRALANTVLADVGITLDGRKTVIYAPTWKGASFYAPANDAAMLLGTVNELESRLGAGYQVLLKVHQTVYRAAGSMPEAAGRLVPNALPTNVLLGLTDVLITDYSSVFYDFLATGRPVAFHIPDLEDYEEKRGTYDGPQALPGPVTRTTDELATRILGFAGEEDGPWRERYESARREFTALEDGTSSSRVVDQVFLGKEQRGTLRGHADGRESMLLYLGGMFSNGITASALNLLNNIDYERYDVSVFYSYSRNSDRQKNAELIDPRARQFPRQGGLNATFAERARYKKQLEAGLESGRDHRATPDPVWDREWHRCFGDSRFDYIVDFSGYGPFWDFILLRGKAKMHTIWLHNDLMSDSRRNVHGKLTMKRHLESVFTTYQNFDRLVSVSADLADVNREHLGAFAAKDKFVSAVNTIDEVRVQRMTAEPAGDDSVTLDSPHLADALKRLAVQFGPEVLQNQVSRAAALALHFPAEDGHKTTFVTVGRMSPEKNQERLIRAFAKVHATYPDTRLMLIGSGPLQPSLRSVAAGLGIQRDVVFTGLQNNPYILMKNADCFVLSSDYEGQPMVILEARTLGLPIITTAFGSVGSAVPPGVGLIVDRDVDALAAGMESYLLDGVPVQPFDPDAYNSDAMDQFYRAIGARAVDKAVAS
ncbi:CDP-glycerol glycerophosphotransferase family protein [Paeniglutamicibacter gangotriensis]|uniref:CDP-glycerol glycerophosphotransferase family protein n=1 Tax=Paeniglutamicibacter gangotriensis TaxID=254787 RepID=UPI0037C504CB